MRNVTAIFLKQIRETFKNKTILVQFLMFPVLTIIMERTIELEGMPDHFFTNLFATMFIGMAPLTSMAAIISEEKEKNTLRVLLMANVKPFEYLIGIGSYIWLICMLGAGVICAAGEYKGETAVIFLTIMGIGIFASLLMGAAIGTWSKNQMMGTSLTVPVMMVFSFLPMLSIFNETIEKIARVTYSQQISQLLSQVEQLEIRPEHGIVILSNVLIFLVLFIYAYRKSGLA